MTEMMMRERAGRRCREDDGAGDQRSLRPPRRLPHARRRYVYVYVLARVSERASNGEEDNETTETTVVEKRSDGNHSDSRDENTHTASCIVMSSEAEEGGEGGGTRGGEEGETRREGEEEAPLARTLKEKAEG